MPNAATAATPDSRTLVETFDIKKPLTLYLLTSTTSGRVILNLFQPVELAKVRGLSDVVYSYES
jgi:hypothetical protein